MIPPVNINLALYALVQDPKYSTPERLMMADPMIFENTQYIPKRREQSSLVKRRMDKFQKTTDYAIRDIQLI